MAVQVVACPGCQATLKAPENMAGKKWPSEKQCEIRKQINAKVLRCIAVAGTEGRRRA